MDNKGINTSMTIAEKLVEPHDINNMTIIIASHLKNSTHAPTNETHKIRDEVITP